MPGFTADTLHIVIGFLLWIDYILYFYARLYSAGKALHASIFVVNWLHFVFLCPALQQLRSISYSFSGCELITFCIFMPGFTAALYCAFRISRLWIDYILYFYARLYSKAIVRKWRNLVVNWLHFVFLCPALQRLIVAMWVLSCCELITFCIFMPGFTAEVLALWGWGRLWIDYILYFYARLYSGVAK